MWYWFHVCCQKQNRKQPWEPQGGSWIPPVLDYSQNRASGRLWDQIFCCLTSAGCHNEEKTSRVITWCLTEVSCAAAACLSFIRPGGSCRTVLFSLQAASVICLQVIRWSIFLACGCRRSAATTWWSPAPLKTDVAFVTVTAPPARRWGERLRRVKDSVCVCRFSPSFFCFFPFKFYQELWNI